MDRERITRALERIEAAAGRIERCAAVRPAATGSSDPEIAAKYERLRSETGAALAELDRVIERLGG